MDMEFTLTWMELNILGNGNMINSMVKEKKFGQMGQDIKAPIRKVKNLEKENSFGLIRAAMKVILKITLFMVMVNIHGMIKEYMKVNGKII